MQLFYVKTKPFMLHEFVALINVFKLKEEDGVSVWHLEEFKLVQDSNKFRLYVG